MWQISNVKTVGLLIMSRFYGYINSHHKECNDLDIAMANNAQHVHTHTHLHTFVKINA